MIVEKLGEPGLNFNEQADVADRDREAVRPRPGRGRDAQPRACSRSSTSARSSGSTTTSARRPSRTSSRSASPTDLRAAVEPQLRRPRPDHRGRGRSGIEGRGPATTTRPARCATSCRTTCCSCSACVAMEPPVDFSADAVRDERVKVLDAIRTPERDRRDVVRGQYARRRRSTAYEVAGYLEEKGVAPDSRTETFVAAAPRRRQLALGRRAVLPAHRQAAARKRVTEIAIQFKRCRTWPSRVAAERRRAEPADPARSSRTRGSRCRFGAKVPGDAACGSAR